MGKFVASERSIVKSIVATLTIARIPDAEIIKEIKKSTGKTISKRSIVAIRRGIKKDSYKWYLTLRKSEYEFIHEVKARINEIIDLQRRLYKIIDENPNNPAVKLNAIAELHKLAITLSNMYDVVPHILANISSNSKHDSTISVITKDKEPIV